MDSFSLGFIVCLLVFLFCFLIMEIAHSFMTGFDFLSSWTRALVVEGSGLENFIVQFLVVLFCNA